MAPVTSQRHWCHFLFLTFKPVKGIVILASVTIIISQQCEVFISLFLRSTLVRSGWVTLIVNYSVCLTHHIKSSSITSARVHFVFILCIAVTVHYELLAQLERKLEMTHEINPVDLTRNEARNHLISLLRDEPVSPNNKNTVWKKYGYPNLTILVSASLASCLLVYIVLIKYTQYFSTSGTVAAFSLAAFLSFLMGEYLIPSMFYSRVKWKAERGVDEWKRDVNAALEKVGDDLHSFSTIAKLTIADIQTLERAIGVERAITSQLQIDRQEHEAAIKEVKYLLEGKERGDEYKGNFPFFRNHILRALDQVAPIQK